MKTISREEFSKMFCPQCILFNECTDEDKKECEKVDVNTLNFIASCIYKKEEIKVI